jgi:transposase InsO family protein
MTTQVPTQPNPHVHFRSTTPDQRCLLFNTVEQTDNVSAAARRAHVGRSTYYYWQPRFEAQGLAGLASEQSRAPHRTRIPPITDEIQAEVLAYHQAHLDEGCRRIADAINQAHNWQHVIGHTKVYELVVAACPPSPLSPESIPPIVTAVVHAPQPNQTVNIDLCVVPVRHTDPKDWVSVSMSAAEAGLLPASPPPPSRAEWPGQVFANSALSYAEQMQTYAAQRTAKRTARGRRKHQRRQQHAARAELKARCEELRLAHRRRRIASQQADQVWKVVKHAHRLAKQTRWQGPLEPEQRKVAWSAHQQQWLAAKALRRAQSQAWQMELAAWRRTGDDLRRQLAQLTKASPVGIGWFAILVVICNGTRRCLGLPMFTAGVHVTADLIVEALRGICPSELEYVISDNGAQFIADTFAEFVKAQEVLHVRIAPHRPCTNGIAERFVRTLKEWLETHAWTSSEELQRLLVEFRPYYNNRPHQGAELAGLSPNEFARRRSDCSTC